MDDETLDFVLFGTLQTEMIARSLFVSSFQAWEQEITRES